MCSSACSFSRSVSHSDRSISPDTAVTLSPHPPSALAWDWVAGFCGRIVRCTRTSPNSLATAATAGPTSPESRRLNPIDLSTYCPCDDFPDLHCPLQSSDRILRHPLSTSNADATLL